MKDHRTTRALAAAAALALTLGACDDTPTGTPPRIAPAGQPVHNVSPSGATLIPNAVKYRDNGGKPATGRSGSAGLEAFALLGKEGRTDLEYRSTADPVQWWVRGIITRAQIKALDADGAVMFTINQNDLDAHGKFTEFGSLTRGQSLQVQANITGSDPHRTDVVTVTERIKLRPDLSVRLEMAPEVPAAEWVPVTATVAELNGDVGASAGCRLRVDGSVVDWAWGVWVDAGDAVSCAFTHAFSPGTHQVQVEVISVEPADWDVANNHSEVVQVEAVGGPTEFRYHAFASASRYHWKTRDESRWHNPLTQRRGESFWEFGTDEDTEYASMDASIDRAVAGEVSIEVSQSTDGRVLHADAWTETLQDCTWRASGGTSFYLCSYAGSWANTWFSYVRNVGSVTYHSAAYAREWDELTGEDIYFYHENSTWGWQEGTLAGLGDEYAFRVHITNGDVVLTAESEFPLNQGAPYSYSYSNCSTWTEPWDGFTSEVCWSSETSSESRSGWDSN